jgi:hypothetical protein
VRSNWWANALEPCFVGLTEGIWIAVLYLLVEMVGEAPATLGPPAFVAIAALMALAGPRLERLGTGRWQAVVLVALVTGAIGMLVAPGVLAALLARDPGAAFAAHPGGWLLGIAAFRGMVGAGALDDPDGASRPFVRGVIGLTFMWLYAGLLPDASQVAFRAVALGPTLLFASAGIVAVGLRRVHAIAAPAGIEWWRNRAWLAALAALVALLALLAVPLANGLTSALPGILGLAGLPEVAIFALFFVWLILPRVGPQRPRASSLRGVLVLAVLLIIGAIAYKLLHGKLEPGNAAAGTPPSVSTPPNDVFGLVIALATLVALGLLGLVLARKWRASPAVAEARLVKDDSRVDVEGPGLAWLRSARNRLFGDRTGGQPTSAEAAYLATLDLLEPLPGLGRLANETPQAHARRLRREGHGTLELDLLVADYELSRWGARRLPGPETRRAISRWDRSRRSIADRILAEQVAGQPAQDRLRSGPT